PEPDGDLARAIHSEFELAGTRARRPAWSGCRWIRDARPIAKRCEGCRALAQIPFLGGFQLVHSLQTKNLFHRDDFLIHLVDPAIGPNSPKDGFHGRNRRAYGVIGVDHHPDLAERLDTLHGKLGIGGGHQNERYVTVPGANETLDLIRR